MTKAEMRRTAAALKSRIAEMRAHCAACDRWECGYCAEPRLNLEIRLERLLLDAAPYGARTLAWLRNRSRKAWARKGGKRA